MCAPWLELRCEARLVEVDAVAAHWDAFCEQQLALWLSLGNCPVGAYDAVPGKIVIGREDMPDEAWGARVDVAVGADVALRDRADTLDHELGPRGAVGQVRLRHAVRLGRGAATTRRRGAARSREGWRELLRRRTRRGSDSCCSGRSRTGPRPGRRSAIRSRGRRCRR